MTLTTQTALAADFLIRGSKLQELLGITSAQLLEIVERHATILIPGIALTEEDLLEAVQEAEITDPQKIQQISSLYIRDAVACTPDFAMHALIDDFKMHVKEFVAAESEVEQLIANLTREQCQKLLNRISIDVTDDDSVHELREAVTANRADETLSDDAIRAV